MDTITTLSIDCTDPVTLPYAKQLRGALESGQPEAATTFAKVKQIFDKHRVWNDVWKGEGPESALERLKKQLVTGETFVYELIAEELNAEPQGTNPQVARTSVVLCIDVRSPDGTQRLREYNSKEGAPLKARRHPGISEKLEAGENPEQAALRAFSEELKIGGLRASRIEKDANHPDTLKYYPDDKGRLFYVALAIHYRVVTLNQDEFKDEYREERPGVVNVFRWEST